MISISCITCDSNSFVPFHKKTDPKNGKLITVVICKMCGTIQVRPRPDEEETLAYYSDTTYRIEKSVDDDAVHEKLVKRGRRILEEFKKLKKPTEKVLEIGCGIGSILQPFKEDGSTIVGYELNPKEVRYGKSKGLDIREGTIDNVEAGTTYDVIIYSHVVEHLTYPQDELLKVRELLNDNGTLVILLPGYYNMQAHRYNLYNYIVYPHLQYFSLRTLTSLLGQVRFKRIYGVEEILAIFEKSTDKGLIVSDYFRAIVYKTLYSIYKPFYIPIYRVKRKLKKLLKLA